MHSTPLSTDSCGESSFYSGIIVAGWGEMFFQQQFRPSPYRVTFQRASCSMLGMPGGLKVYPSQHISRAPAATTLHPSNESAKEHCLSAIFMGPLHTRVFCIRQWFPHAVKLLSSRLRTGKKKYFFTQCIN